PTGAGAHPSCGGRARREAMGRRRQARRGGGAMSRAGISRALAAALGLAAITAAADAAAISRGEVIARAKSFSFHPWTCGLNNLTATCSAAYQSVYVPGDYVGLPYDWGGY